MKVVDDYEALKGDTVGDEVHVVEEAGGLGGVVHFFDTVVLERPVNFQ